VKLKHMHVQYNRIPNQAATLYYAYGEQDGRMFESNVVVNDTETITKSREQIDYHVTQQLEQGIRELTIQEQHRRKEEMKGGILC
jgi:hypothetical protein